MKATGPGPVGWSLDPATGPGRLAGSTGVALPGPGLTSWPGPCVPGDGSPDGSHGSDAAPAQGSPVDAGRTSAAQSALRYSFQFKARARRPVLCSRPIRASWPVRPSPGCASRVETVDPPDGGSGRGSAIWPCRLIRCPRPRLELSAALPSRRGQVVTLGPWWSLPSRAGRRLGFRVPGAAVPKFVARYDRGWI